jgi:hypothetical protein
VVGAPPTTPAPEIIEDEIIEDDAPDPNAQRRQQLDALNELVKPMHGRDGRSRVLYATEQEFQKAGYTGRSFTFGSLRKWLAAQYQQL